MTRDRTVPHSTEASRRTPVDGHLLFMFIVCVCVCVCVYVCGEHTHNASRVHDTEHVVHQEAIRGTQWPLIGAPVPPQGPQYNPMDLSVS